MIWRQNRRAAFGSSESSTLAVIVPASQRETGHRKEFELLAAVWTDLVRPAALWLWHHAREDLEQNLHPDAISLEPPSSRIQFAGRTTSRHCYRAALAPTSSHRCCWFGVRSPRREFEGARLAPGRLHPTLDYVLRNRTLAHQRNRSQRLG